jgi:hypothetical protein
MGLGRDFWLIESIRQGNDQTASDQWLVVSERQKTKTRPRQRQSQNNHKDQDKATTTKTKTRQKPRQTKANQLKDIEGEGGVNGRHIEK